MVLAFEYLTVLLCGLDARSWNHVTIAQALGAMSADEPTDEMIARLYALARYSPGTEALSAGDLAEARRLACRLAGVSPA